MVYISKDQMEELQFILSQSESGVHLLFENDCIKKVFSKEIDEIELFSDDKVKEVESLMEDFISIPSISARKTYFETLSEIEQEMIVRSYFNIIGNNILSQGRLLN